MGDRLRVLKSDIEAELDAIARVYQALPQPRHGAWSRPTGQIPLTSCAIWAASVRRIETGPLAGNCDMLTAQLA